MQFRFVEPNDPSSPPLILLHGSGGNETDMLPVAAAASPGSAAFSVRGAVKWEDGYAFFRRFPDRRIDEDSIRAEAPALAAFIAETIAAHRFQSKPILVGFSNGAIMVAALMMLFPNLVQGAALLRPLSPFAMPTETRLPATPVLVIDALNDARRQPGDGLEMASQLRQMGAIVTHHSLATGHDLTEGDLDLLRGWLMKRR
jgi:phospholipase/carboxylesterase